jgi:lipid II:glycine glycyltransferase (peptidoglycan interpeptide bridge formation enzyme)
MVHFGRKLHYLFGGSRPMHQQLKPNYLVHWRAIQEARRAGLTEYDMWGVPYAPREGERGWGYYVFKSKFNARHVRFPGMLEMRTSAILGGALRVAESLVRRSEPEFA